MALFDKNNKLIEKQNHLTGVIEQAYINEGKFHENYHNFENFGHALDPSDTTGNK